MNKLSFGFALISWAAMSLSALAANTITAITVKSNSATQATVKYTTSTAVASQVKYGATSSYGKSVSDSSKVKAHSVVITGLKASTTYHYQIVAGAIVSPDATFVTAAKAGAAPSPSPSPSASPSAKPSSAPSPSPTVSAAPSSKPSSAPSSSPSPTASPLIEGYVSDIASYGFDMNCGMTNTVEDEEYGCLPVTTTGAKIVANGQTLQPGVYIRIYGSFDASNLPMVLATEVDYSATAFSGSPTIPAPTSTPSSSPVPAPTQTSSGGIPNVVKVWLGSSWSGLGPQYNCNMPSYTNPGSNGKGSNYSMFNNLVFLESDYCYDSSAWHSTAPNVLTTTYEDFGALCYPSGDGCSDSLGSPPSLNMSTDVLQCTGQGTFIGSYQPGSSHPTIIFPDPGSSNVLSQIKNAQNQTNSSQNGVNVMWWDNMMIMADEWWPAAGTPCTPNADAQNLSFGTGGTYSDASYINKWDALENQMPVPVLNEGLCNSDGQDGSPLGSGNAWDPSPTILMTTQGGAGTWGGMCESFGIGWGNSGELNGKSVNPNDGSANSYMWSINVNSEIQTTSAQKYFTALEYESGGNTDQRGYIYSSLMLAFDPNYTVASFNGASGPGSIAPLQPEMGIVPLNPRVSLTWPTRISAIQVNGGNYIREYQNCYYFGHSMGNCAFIVNPNPNSTYSVPSLAGTYNYSIGLNGSGIFNGQWGQPNYGDDQNNISFTNGKPSSIGPAGWTILIQNAPSGGP